MKTLVNDSAMITIPFAEGVATKKVTQSKVPLTMLHSQSLEFTSASFPSEMTHSASKEKKIQKAYFKKKWLGFCKHHFFLNF